MLEELLAESITSKIFILRGRKVMMDRDLAFLYKVSTKRLNEQVKRNIKRFPSDFMFQLTSPEKIELVAICDRFNALKHSTVMPYAFTEQGVAMLSSVLNSERAILVNIQIMRAFTQLRRMLLTNHELRRKITEIEKTAKDLHKRILAGEDFGKLAVKYSQGAGAQLGGDIGYFHKGELMADIDQLAFSLKNGQVSSVFRTELGFHIIKVLDQIGGDGDNAAPAGSWQDRRKEIQDILYGAQFEKEMSKWMQGVKERAYIELN